MLCLRWYSWTDCPGMQGGRKPWETAWHFEKDIAFYQGWRPWYVWNQNPTRCLIWIPVGSLVMHDDETTLLPRNGFHPWRVESDDIDSDSLSEEFFTDESEEEPEEAPPYQGPNLCIVRVIQYWFLRLLWTKYLCGEVCWPNHDTPFASHCSQFPRWEADSSWVSWNFLLSQPD